MAGEVITKEQAIEQYGAGLIEVAEQMGYDFNKADEHAKDPKQFVLDIREVSRSNAKGKQSLERRLSTMDRELKKVNQQLGDVHKFYTQQTRGQLMRLRSDLEEQRQEAIDAQDTEKFNKIDKNLRDLEKRHGLELDNPNPPIAPGKAQASDDISDLPEEFQEWVDQKDWWDADPIARAHAEAFNASLPDEAKISLPDRLKAIDNEMDFYFARRNGGTVNNAAAVNNNQQQRKQANDVEGGGGNAGGGGTAPTKVSYSDLPDEAKITCKSFVDQGLGSREDFLNSLTPDDIADWNRGR
jgi:hypothetical protein